MTTEYQEHKDIIYVPAKMAHVDTDAPVLAVKLGEKGYWPIYTDASADDLNRVPLSKAVMESAISGSMFGWDAPIAQLAKDFLKECK